MPDRQLRVSANISVMFTEVPYLDRPAAARAAGFDLIESWWPFPGGVATDAQIDELVQAFDRVGVELTGLNFFAGDMPAGQRGVASRPDRQAELDANIEQMVEISRRTGCRAFNLLYGQLDAAWPEDEQHRVAVAAIRRAAEAVQVVGGTVLIEPLAAGLNGAYPWKTGDDVVGLLSGALGDVENVKMLFDVFHLGANGVGIVEAATRLAPWVGHVQLADSPGRGEPGSGTLPIERAVQALVSEGYDGLVAGEYIPTKATQETLDWMSWDVFEQTTASAGGNRTGVQSSGQ